MGIARAVVVTTALLMLAPALALSAAAQSEALVRGQAVAARDGSALAQASVTLRSADGSRSRTAPTDAEGRFTFVAVAPGAYVLTAAADGFAPAERRIRVAPREARVETLALEIAALDVTVRVDAATDLPGAHAPSATLLTAERLEALPASQRSTLPDVILTSAPGMIRGHDDLVHIRGHEVALNPLIDGVGFWENPHTTFSAGMSPEIIASANVMTGGFPAEYGNRFGGVVDVVTKSGRTMRGRGSVLFSGGQEGRRRMAADGGGSRGRLAFYAFGSAFETGRFFSPPDPRALHDRGRGVQAFVRVDLETADRGSFTVTAMGDGADAQVPRTPLDEALRPLAKAEQRARQQTLTVGWSRASGASIAHATLYERWSRTVLVPADGPLTARADLSRELFTLGARADVARLAGRHTLKGGVDVVRLAPRERLVYGYAGYRELTHLLGLPHIHVHNQQIAFSDRDTGYHAGLFVQDTLALGRVTANVGVRLDRHALVVSETHASPRVNLAVRLGRAVLYASYNHFFVPPPIEGVLSSSAGLTSQIQEIGVALPPLRPTVEHQTEAGASRAWGPLTVAATSYYRVSERPVHTTVWPDARIYSYASFDRARAYGAEFKATAPGLARFGVTGYLNYALGRVYFYNPVGGGFITDAGHVSDVSRFPAPMDQTHTMTAGVSYRHGRSGVWGGLAAAYGSGTPMGHGGAHDHGDEGNGHTHAQAEDGPARVPAHTIVSATAGVDLVRRGGRPRVSLQVDAENLSNRAHLVAQESAFAPAQYSMRRVVSVTVRVGF